MLFDDDDYLKRFYDFNNNDKIDDYERDIAWHDEHDNWDDDDNHISHSSCSSNGDNSVLKYSIIYVLKRIGLIYFAIFAIEVIFYLFLTSNLYYTHVAKKTLNGEYDEVRSILADRITMGSHDTPTSLFIYNAAREDFYKGDYVEAKADLECVRKENLPSVLHEDYDYVRKTIYDDYNRNSKKYYQRTEYYTETTTKKPSTTYYYEYIPNTRKNSDYYDVDEFVDAEDFYDYYYDDFYDLEEAEDYYYEHS